MVKIIFDNSHGEDAELEREGENSLSKLALSLRKDKYVLGEIHREQDFTLQTLRNASVVVISFPKKRFSSRTVEAVLNYVEGGGGLLLTGEWGNLHESADILNTLSQSFNVVFNKDRITDQRDVHEEEVRMMGHSVGKRKEPTYATIRKFALHPITNDLHIVGHVSGCSLGAPKYTVLAWSDDQSFADMDMDGELDPDEVVGSFATAVHPDIRTGRVVCLGDTSILTNRYIGQMDNRRFLLNTFAWLAKLM
jgi:hypothetical protein